MKIVFFDGYCSLCDGVVSWLMEADSKHVLKFASLQGETARTQLPDLQGRNDFDTMIYLRDGVKFEGSDAVLKVLADVGGVWSLAQGLLGIPRPLRDLLYRLVATNRYRLFKKKDSCRIPSLEERERVLS